MGIANIRLRVGRDYDGGAGVASLSTPDMIYLGALATRLSNQGLMGLGRLVSDRCPECMYRVSPMTNNRHIHVLMTYNTVDFVAIGCEGYHVIDPGLLGIRNSNWIGPNG
jgi:hypothetical protein